MNAKAYNAYLMLNQDFAASDELFDKMGLHDKVYTITFSHKELFYTLAKMAGAADFLVINDDLLSELGESLVGGFNDSFYERVKEDYDWLSIDYMKKANQDVQQ